MTSTPTEAASLASLLRQAGREISRLVVRPEDQNRSDKEVREDDLRLYLLVRMDLNIPFGKALPQAGHGYMDAFLEAMAIAPERAAAYVTTGARAKIAKEAKNLAALERAQRECQDLGIPTVMIKDAGWTVFKERTVTCLGVGPARRSELPKFVERMRLIKADDHEVVAP
jgi:PTH2 family peptidyl-tRNA hydrolase